MNAKALYYTALWTLGLVFTGAPEVCAQKLFWGSGSSSSIIRSDPDGSNKETLVSSGLSLPNGMDINVQTSTLYFSDGTTIKSASALSAGPATTVLTGQSARDVVVDSTNGHLYWTQGGTTIRRSNLDGSSVTDVVTGRVGLRGMALDVAGDKMYWTETDNSGAVVSANLDGSSISTVVTTNDTPDFIEIDVSNGTMYWIADSTLINTANISGVGGASTLITVPTCHLYDLALDRTNQLIYFGDQAGGEIRRIDYSGGANTFIISESDPRGMVFAIPEPSTYALIVALLALGAAAYRRWRVSKAEAPE